MREMFERALHFIHQIIISVGQSTADRVYVDICPSEASSMTAIRDALIKIGVFLDDCLIYSGEPPTAALSPLPGHWKQMVSS